MTHHLLHVPSHWELQHEEGQPCDQQIIPHTHSEPQQPTKPVSSSCGCCSGPTATIGHLNFFKPHAAVFKSKVEGQYRHWHSRRHRKGKPALQHSTSQHALLPTSDHSDEHMSPPTKQTNHQSASGTPRQQRRLPLFQRVFPIWNLSWWTAFLFTVGSAWWIVNGVFVFHLPLEPENRNNVWAGAFAIAGGFFFWLGGWSYLWEALNQNPQGAHCDDEVARRDASPIRRHLKGQPLLQPLNPSSSSSDSDQPQSHSGDAETGEAQKEKQQQPSQPRPAAVRPLRWRWFGWGSIRDLGWIASFFQWVGTEVFFIGPIFYMPAYLVGYAETEHQAAWDGLYWWTQIIGAACLLISSGAMLLECQRHWWLPSPLRLGWQVGIWNVIGSLGFLLSPIFALVYRDDERRLYGVALVSYIGSLGYFIGSALQLLEVYLP